MNPIQKYILVLARFSSTDGRSWSLTLIIPTRKVQKMGKIGDFLEL